MINIIDTFNRAAAKAAAIRAGQVSDFADQATAGQQAIDAGASIVTSAAMQAAMDNLLGPVLKATAAGTSYEAMMNDVLDAHPQMNITEAKELIARCIFVSELWGRISVQEGL